MPSQAVRTAFEAPGNRLARGLHVEPKGAANIVEWDRRGALRVENPPRGRPGAPSALRVWVPTYSSLQVIERAAQQLAE
jgi:hypothetical protein